MPVGRIGEEFFRVQSLPVRVPVVKADRRVVAETDMHLADLNLVTGFFVVLFMAEIHLNLSI